MSACCPLSTTVPVAASTKDEARPPSRERASSTVTRAPCSASATPAARPAKPPPITTRLRITLCRKLGPSPGSERESHVLIAWQGDALVEDVEAARLDACQQPLVDEPHGFRGRERTAILGREGPARAQVVGASPTALERHQRAHSWGVAAGEELLLVAAEVPQILERQVDAAAGAVLAHVAQDVGELERDAEVVRIVHGGGMPAAEDLDAQEADGGGDQVAVLLELVEGPVAPAREIHLDAADQVREVPVRQGEASHGVGERDADGVGRRSRVHAIELLPPAREQGSGVARTGVEPVGNVVDETAERVHRVEGGTALRTEQPKGLREAAAAAARDRMAVSIGSCDRGVAHAERPERRGSSRS